jgi:hypothetical protein
MVADELRRQADQFIDLADLEDHVGRDPSTRPMRARASARGTVASANMLDYPEDDKDD